MKLQVAFPLLNPFVRFPVLGVFFSLIPAVTQLNSRTLIIFLSKNSEIIKKNLKLKERNECYYLFAVFHKHHYIVWLKQLGSY